MPAMIPTIGGRYLRPFISSTFTDMKAERDFLINFTVPALRRKCEERGVIWGYVDLRWGIDPERSTRGEVLTVCLAEIRRSHPVFVCILGERYGSQPQKLERDLLIREQWLSNYPDRSVTELEILSSALNPDLQDVRAFFYFRDPHVIETLPDSNPEDAAKLENLKNRIRVSGHKVRENFRSPRELGDWIEEDLTHLLDEMVPLGTNVDVRQQQATEQEAFILSRTEGYFRNDEMFLALDHHATGNDERSVLVIHGESGLGKTALLANWSREFQLSYPDHLVFTHFIGAAERSSRWQTVAQRLWWELQAALGDEESEPADDTALRKQIPRCIENAAAQSRIVIVIDALNQLEHNRGALDLGWLPRKFPRGVRVILSTLAGEPLEAAKNRGWQLREMPALDPNKNEVIALARKYLRTYGKEEGLNKRQWDLIGKAAQNTNPLFLFTLLEEVRVWGQPETLDHALEDYLSAATTVELFKKVLARYSREYDTPYVSDLVAKAMRLLWASRGGLREAEILDLLGRDGQPLPAAYWFPLANAAGRALVARSGIIGFAHLYFRDAVEECFLKTAEDKQQARHELATYFGKQKPDTQKNAELALSSAQGRRWRRHGSDDFVDRHTDEYPWQLEQAGDWEALAQWLSKLPEAIFAFLRARNDYLRYWLATEKNSEIRAVDCFHHVIENPEAHPNAISLVISVLHALGHDSEMGRLAGHVVQQWECDERPEYETALNNYLHYLASQGEFQKARQVCANTRASFASKGLHLQCGRVLLLESQLCQQQLQLDVAADLANQAFETFTELGETDEARTALIEKAKVLMARGDYAAALTSLENIINDARAAEDPLNAIVILSYMSEILVKLNRETEAEALYAETEQLVQALGQPDLLGVLYVNRATEFHHKHQLKEALEWYRKGEQLLKSGGDLSTLSQCWNNMSVLFQDQGDNASALQYAETAERFFRDAARLELLCASLSSKAMILWGMERYDDSQAAFKAAEAAARQSNKPEVLVRELANQALFFSNQGSVDDLIQILDEVHGLIQTFTIAQHREQLKNVVTVCADRLAMKVLEELVEDNEAASAATAMKLRHFCEKWNLTGSVEAYFLTSDALVALRNSKLETALGLMEEAAKLLPATASHVDPHFQLKRVLIYLVDRVQPPKHEEIFAPENEQHLQKKEAVLRMLGAKEELVRCLCARCLLYIMVLDIMPPDLTEEARAAIAAAGHAINGPITMRDVRMGSLHQALRIADEAAKLVFTYHLDAEKADTLRCYSFLTEVTEKLTEPLLELGRFEEACELADIGSRAARKAGDAAMIARTLTHHALLLEVTGKHDLALVTAREAVELAHAAGRSDLAEMLRPLIHDGDRDGFNGKDL